MSVPKPPWAGNTTFSGNQIRLARRFFPLAFPHSLLSTLTDTSLQEIQAIHGVRHRFKFLGICLAQCCRMFKLCNGLRIELT